MGGGKAAPRASPIRLSGTTPPAGESERGLRAHLAQASTQAIADYVQNSGCSCLGCFHGNAGDLGRCLPSSAPLSLYFPGSLRGRRPIDDSRYCVRIARFLATRRVYSSLDFKRPYECHRRPRKLLSLQVASCPSARMLQKPLNAHQGDQLCFLSAQTITRSSYLSPHLRGL
jgi:hypothetical protein